MKIKTIYIEGFGCLCDFSYTFNDEVNIIKYDNEQGKTTIAQFIRAMLYGFASGARNIKNNPRKKYMPWGKTTMGGELLVEHNGVEYLIIRTFGEHKSDDKINVINNVTGESVLKYCTDCPCYEITGVGAESFDKALYLNHLSIDMDSKKDEIMDKLIALSQSGDEEFSYKWARVVLDTAIKELSGSRTGKIKETKDQLEKLYSELTEKQKAIENLDKIRNINKSLEEKEQALKSVDNNGSKTNMVLWIIMAVVSIGLYFLKPWLCVLGILLTSAFVVKCVFDDKKQKEKQMNELLEISREIGTNKGALKGAENINIESTVEKIDYAKKLMDKYQQKLNDLVFTRDCLDDAFAKIQQGFGTKLNESVAEILSVITEGKYDGVKVDKDFEMTVHCKDGWQSAQFLSEGAYSQIYFALKMAVVKMLFPEMPLLLDDPFVLYDDKRLSRAMEYLSNCESQVILLTR